MTATATTFHDLGVDATLADALTSKGIVHPFPIQELTLPMALKGADLIGQARTGTGKTLAFGLPLLQRIDPDLQKTQALVIVPTRELCLQVAEDLTVGKARGVTSIAIYGGVGYEEQIEALTGGVNVVIGTPGRTLDHLNRGNLDLSSVHVVVLDEADEMLDMGFLPDVERLLTEVPDDRQTLLFSATMPAVIVKLARRFMSKPTFMRAESEERQTSSGVEQHFFLVHRMDKPRVLARILQSEDRGGAFVFTRTKNMADRLVRELEDLKVAAIAVHGDLRQTTREKNLDLFRAGKADVLIATEVAARGLDVTNVSHVFNYDCPDDEKMYLHRIGRTARAGGSGVAVTFAEFNEIDRLNVIRKAVQAEGEVTEVFSTSDILTELFDLPDRTPWDHMARGGTGSRTVSRGPDRSGGDRDGSRSSSSDRDTRRRSSSDGRNKSRRGSDGSRPASRDRQDRARSDDTGTPAPSTPKRPQRSSGRSRDDEPASSSSSSNSSRERTRTRSRSRTRDDDTSSSRPRARTSRGKDDTASTGSSSGGRTRARTSRTADDGDTDGGSSSSSRSGSSGKSADDRGGNRKGTGKGKGGSGGASSKRSSSRSKKPSDTGDRESRSGDRGSEISGGAGTTRRGEAARGDGTPRPRRRVKVDNLP